MAFIWDELAVGKIYTIDGDDRWECVSFKQPSFLGLPVCKFENLSTGGWIEGTINGFPEFRRIQKDEDVQKDREKEQRLLSVLEFVRQLQKAYQLLGDVPKAANLQGEILRLQREAAGRTNKLLERIIKKLEEQDRLLKHKVDKIGDDMDKLS